MAFACLAGFFAVVVGVNAVMIRAAVSTFGGVETESSYKAGLAFAREEAAAKAQDNRNWRVNATIAGMSGQQRIEIVAEDPGHLPLTGLSVTVRLAHPTDRRSDVTIEMTEVAPGRYAGNLKAVAGQWDMVIDLSRGGAAMFRSRNRVFLRKG